jgi:hypothetical protein
LSEKEGIRTFGVFIYFNELRRQRVQIVSIGDAQ